MLASAFLASGFELGYTAKQKGDKSNDNPQPKSPLIKKTRPDTPRPPLAMIKARLPKSFKSLEEILEESEEESDEENESDKKSPKSNSSKIEGGDRSPKKKSAKKSASKQNADGSLEDLSQYVKGSA